MGKSKPSEVCTFHPGLPAITKCAACAVPLCGDCACERDGQAFCGTMCADEFSVQRGEQRRQSRHGIGALVGWLTRSAVRLVLVVLLLVVIAAVLLLPFTLEKAATFAALDKYRAASWSAPTLYLAGSINTRCGRYDAALPILHQALKYYPDHARTGDATYQIGLCLEKTGDAETAHKAFKHFLAHFPDHRWADQAQRKLDALAAENW